MSNLDPQYEMMIKDHALHTKESVYSLCEEVRRLESVIVDAATALNPNASDGEDLLTIVRDMMADYKTLIMAHESLKQIHEALKVDMEKTIMKVMEQPTPIVVTPFGRSECIYQYCYDPHMCKTRCTYPRGA